MNRALERRNPPRIPLVWVKWWTEGLEGQCGDDLRRFDRYPEDAVIATVDTLNVEAMDLSWEYETEGARDAVCVFDDWSKLDEFVA